MIYLQEHTMTLNCYDMPCPEPVLATKKALEELPEDAILEVELNTVSSIANVQRFARNGGYDFRLEEHEDGTALITIIKGYLCEIAAPDSVETDSHSPFLERTLFFRNDGVGEGELGRILVRGFLKSLLEFEKLPRNIIFVNRGVLLTTDTETNGDVIDVLTTLADRGVSIYSCGLCMEHFGIDPARLQVGEIGNAYDTMEMLLHTEAVTL
jgi:selenium metabolism protein YedF